MGTGCSSVIEWRDSNGWHVFPEEVENARFYGCAFDTVYIPRGAELYKILGWLHEAYNLAMPRTEGAPEDMSADLSKHLYEWEDCDACERMNFMTLDQLRAASVKWDGELAKVSYDQNFFDGKGIANRPFMELIQPGEDVKVALRERVAAAERASATHGGAEVRMVYWFTS